mgnify:CR=1 FL=1
MIECKDFQRTLSSSKASKPPNMVSPRILVVLTSFGYIPSVDKSTGWYLVSFLPPLMKCPANTG